MFNFFSSLNFSFGSTAFTAAVVAVAAGPVIIHLLNRRRFRVVNWAAMDFLKQALQRNRKIMRIRDFILLALRTACLLLFGAALAGPYFSRSAAEVSGDQPIHAVLVVDNSLSMGYESDHVQGSLLDEAKARAERFIDELPDKSQVTVLPLCGAADGFSFDPYRTQEDALEALAKIQVVDRGGGVLEALAAAKKACDDGPKLAKRVVFLSDQQEQNWNTGELARVFEQIPELQVVSVAPQQPENVWISEFRVRDDIADVQTPTHFVARMHYEGSQPRANLQIALWIDGSAEVHSEQIDLQPGQSREVDFAYTLSASAVETQPQRPTFIGARVEVRVAGSGETGSSGGALDRLEADNRRYLVVPVVASLPVLFVDQWGEDEEPQKNLYGETYSLRAWLAPRSGRKDTHENLIRPQQATIGELSQELLQNQRLVVVAGTAAPDASQVKLLREFVLQGGQLLIAAGAEFDPAAWNEAAWQDGLGILPAPLAPELFSIHDQREGKSSDGPAETIVELSMQSMQSGYFRVPGHDEQELRGWLSEPKFFRAVHARLDQEMTERLVDRLSERIAADRLALDESSGRLKALARKEAQGNLTPDEQSQREQDTALVEQLNPSWLLWASQSPIDDRSATPRQLAERALPIVKARYTNDLPFMVERDIGRGRVILVTTGLSNDSVDPWNTMWNTAAQFVYDRLLRSMLRSTLPDRNPEAGGSITIPIDEKYRRHQFTLIRPDEREETLTVDALGGDQYGVTVRGAVQRGLYKVTAAGEAATDDNAGGTDSGGEKQQQWVLAVNGPAKESELRVLPPDKRADRVGQATNVRWVDREDRISVDGALVWGSIGNIDFWKLLIALVLVLLLVEMAILAWPVMTRTTRNVTREPAK